MTTAELARELRVVGPDDDLSDDTLIGCYVRCHRCNKRAIPLDDLDLVIARAETVEGFIGLLDQIDETHPGRAHLPDCPERKS